MGDSSVTVSRSKMQVKVGAVQAEPAWLDLQASVDKTIAYIEQAGRENVNVLGFPEVWIPGYPWWVPFLPGDNQPHPNTRDRAIWTKSMVENTELIHTYMANSMAKDSPEMDRIRAAVKAAGIFIVLGYSERAGSSIYIAQSYIDTSGEIVHHRRKIKPTGVERAIWGDGQADSLKTVVDTPFGKVGGLNCWEHLQPLLRYYEYSQGVQIHVAGWPPFFKDPAAQGMAWPFHETAEANSMASQFLAMEGACFVLLASQVVKPESLEKINMAGFPLFKTVGDNPMTDHFILDMLIPEKGGGGFSQIFGPDGRPLAKALDQSEEGIITADIDLSHLDYAKSMIDTVGHYSRPDLLSLLVTQTAATVVTRKE
jgi:nitrilase